MAKKAKPGRFEAQKPVYTSQQAIAAALGWNRSTFRLRMSGADWPVKRAAPWSKADAETLREWAGQRFSRPDLAIADADPLLTGDDTPALERYRTAKAKLAELDLERQRGETVNVAKVRNGMLSVAQCYRDAAALLGREFGREAQRIVDDAVDEAKRLIDSLFPAEG